MNTCSTCGSPMKPLFTGLYCQNNCDIHGKWKRYKESSWFYIELKVSDMIPPDATHGWWMNEVDGIDMNVVSGPWTLESRKLDKTKSVPSLLAVFKKFDR